MLDVAVGRLPEIRPIPPMPEMPQIVPFGTDLEPTDDKVEIEDKGNLATIVIPTEEQPEIKEDFVPDLEEKGEDEEKKEKKKPLSDDKTSIH